MLATVLPADLPAALQKIGTSQMDMYTGALAPEVIFEEVIGQLTAQNILLPTAFAAWVATRDGYMEVTLSDTSCWILRLSDDAVRYIHLHPGRYSPHSLRIKAAALKTAMAYKAAAANGLLTGELLVDMNAVRGMAALSPVRSLEDAQHILKIISLVTQG
ncbi:hypothetical protein HHL17_27260 [Chitinophaga sp. G-6-1-13]|uniref:Uncharacterized protein n=1 Tax=Chitinophaga fulva TaxID=2728842 RepID=A0A848GRA6_9BACT|nr:hypothetical protein [Chitinophaga fulva]NML40924.1 hypothetical protein [Chitinophaga fulva]